MAKGTVKIFADAHREFLLDNYNAGKGTQWLATELKTHRMTIVRALKSLGVKMRTKSESQTLNLKLNGHPLSGKEMSEETKTKISESVHDRYANLTQKEKDRISQDSKMRWEARPDREKEMFRKSGVVAIRDAAKNGSKMEHYIYKGLVEAGYSCQQHKQVLQNYNLEVDILFTDRLIALEIDGPSHIQPVWGNDALSKTHKADNDKNGLLVLNGYKIIRLQTTSKNTTNKLLRDSLNKVLELLKNIENGVETRNIIIEQV